MPNANMKNKLIILLTCFISFLSTGQNLVTNGNFELYTTCPTYTGSTMFTAQDWQLVGATWSSPDYYDTCQTSLFPNGTLPITFLGYQNDCCGGGGFVGMWAFHKTEPDIEREYIQIKLTDTLITSHMYVCKMLVNLANESEYAIKTMGMYFSPTPYYAGSTGSVTGLINITNPQIQSASVINDTVSWVTVQDTFIANGNEAYLLIGNFQTDISSDTIFLWNKGHGGCTYIYVDSVSVLESGQTEVFESKHNKFLTNIYPNPTNNTATLSFDNRKKEICTLTLYDKQGTVVQTTKNIIADKTEIKRDNLQNGLYYYVLCSLDHVIATGKLVLE